MQKHLSDSRTREPHRCTQTASFTNGAGYGLIPDTAWLRYRRRRAARSALSVLWSCTVNIFTARIMLASCQSPQLSAQHGPLAGRATKSSERARKPRAQEGICYHSIQTLQSESLLYMFKIKYRSNITQKNETKMCVFTYILQHTLRHQVKAPETSNKTLLNTVSSVWCFI